MIQPNLLMTALAALIPLVIGFVWYNPKVLGNAWMQASGMTEEKAKGANMPLIFILTYVFSFFIAFTANFIAIHQFGVQSTLLDANKDLFKEGTELNTYFKNLMDLYGHNYRTFKHGAFHGVFSGLTFVMPIMAINAMFERKGFKYIAINAGYWIVSLALMCGIVCAAV